MRDTAGNLRPILVQLIPFQSNGLIIWGRPCRCRQRSSSRPLHTSEDAISSSPMSRASFALSSSPHTIPMAGTSTQAVAVMSPQIQAQAPPKKRRIHPIRTVARLILKLHRAPTQVVVGSQHSCRGPSLLHNLLPILEPLFAVDPKLLFIEDHIIGRVRAQPTIGSFQLPTSVDELKYRVAEEHASCDCDECAPKIYQVNGDDSHGAIQFEHDGSQKARFTHTPATLNPSLPRLRLKLYGEFETMRLVRHHVEWLDNTYLSNPTGADSPMVNQMKSLLDVWLPHLTGADMRRTISRPQMLRLFSTLNSVFFYSAVPVHNSLLSTGFSWLLVSKQDCFGKSYFNPILGTQIFLHPTLYRHNKDPESISVRLRNRLGTILHEMCHAFLKAYTCRSCPMHDKCVGPRGHGRAWQILSAKIEQVATVLLGGYVDMGRYPSLLHDMAGHGVLPSMHDLEVYGWARDASEQDVIRSASETKQ